MAASLCGKTRGPVFMDSNLKGAWGCSRGGLHAAKFYFHLCPGVIGSTVCLVCGIMGLSVCSFPGTGGSLTPLRGRLLGVKLTRLFCRRFNYHLNN